MLIRQMEATSTQALAGSVSLLCIGHQAILDAYLCLLHLTTGSFPETEEVPRFSWHLLKAPRKIPGSPVIRIWS